MASIPALKRSAAAPAPPPALPDPAPPLRAWRLRQRVAADPATRATRTMSVTDAAALFSAFVGRNVPYQTWHSWEQPPGARAFKDPSPEYKKLLFLFTGGEIRPDHAYPIDEWRAELAALPRAADFHESGALRHAQDGG